MYLFFFEGGRGTLLQSFFLWPLIVIDVFLLRDSFYTIIFFLVLNQYVFFSILILNLYIDRMKIFYIVFVSYRPWSEGRPWDYTYHRNVYDKATKTYEHLRLLALSNFSCIIKHPIVILYNIAQAIISISFLSVSVANYPHIY